MKKTLLIILDGWGIAKDKKTSAIDNAGNLYYHSLIKKHPNSTIMTYGKNVGLPSGQMGNSEVGHLNIGAGRIVYQELLKINNAINNGSFQKNVALNRTFNYCKTNKKKLHIIGLYSDGGVHSHSDHFLSIINYAEKYGLSEIYLHLFTDGRDCDPNSGKELIQNLKSFLSTKKTRIASICGRYYAMDRDKRWERIKTAYDLLVNGIGKNVDDEIQEILDRYKSNETDEFIQPMKCNDYAPIKDGDAVICINFRTDRCRQITQVLTQNEFPDFEMKPLDLYFTTMTEYNWDFKNINVIFNSNNIENTLGEVLQNNNKNQIRIAETEKYPHVTFFFSGGREEKFENESRHLIPSPKIATYDLKPEMSAYEVNEALISSIKDRENDFIVVNFANTDMVGHTGVFTAAIQATKAVDNCLAKTIPIAKENNYNILIIADHGNSEYMINPDGSPNTAHTTNLVPAILISDENYRLKNGILADIAPTILDLMGIEKPDEMTGNSLIK